MPICTQCGTENPDVAKFCLACGSPLAEAPPAQEFRKVVTIVFSDLKGSTAVGERLDSESLREVMTRYFDTMRAELERHSGVVEKFIGDAVMAVFGLPKLHEDDALRAVRAAAGMQRALAELNEELERGWGVRLANRTGVNTGEVVAGDPSTGQRLVTGDAVNVAARLEQVAGESEVLLGELTYRLVRDVVEVEPVEPLELKGKAQPVPAFRLVSVADTGEGWARRRDAPIVGREAELDVLARTFEETLAARTCTLVTVVADAGVGKSRLCDEFLHKIARRAQILRGRCLSYGEGITFWPLVEAVRQAAAIREDDPADTARDKLASLLGEGHDAIVARVGAAVGFGAEQFPVEELFWGARKLLETLARRGPLVVLFDDIHWAEPTFLDLIEHLVDSMRDAPVFLLCPTRHDLLEQRPEWVERPGATHIVLEPLTAVDTETIVENLLGEAGIAENVRARIVTAAEGNPLFVEQMLSMLIDSEVLRFVDGRWTAVSDLAGFAVPPTIQALLAARLDTLTSDERAVVEPASVIGQIFPLLAVQELAPDKVRARVSTHLSDLTRKQLVRPDLSSLDEERFRFGHVLIREAAYNGLLKRTRATLHERFVAWADRVNRERGRELEYEEILGYHLEQAHRHLSELGPLDDHGHAIGGDAARRLSSAGERAFARGDMGAAANLLGRAAALRPAEDVERLRLLPMLAEALMESGEFASADATLDEILQPGIVGGHPRLEAEAVLTRLLVQHRVTSDLAAWRAEVTREAERLIPHLEEISAHAELAKAWRLLGYVHGTVCHWGEQVTAVQRALEHVRVAGNERLEARLSAAYTFGLCYGPTPVPEAVRRCTEIVDRRLPDRQAEAIARCSLSSLLAMSGDFDGAREQYGVGRDLLSDLGGTVLTGYAVIASARVELLAGDPTYAERELAPVFDRLGELGEGYYRPLIGALLGQTLHALGRIDDAERVAGEAAAIADEDDVETQALLYSLRAKLLAQAGALERAVELARRGVEFLASTDEPVTKGNALVDLSGILLLAGQAEEARTLLIVARGMYEDKGDVVSAARVRSLVADEQFAVGLG